jgi:hypothetical protein
METSPQTKVQALSALARVALLAAVAVFALRFADVASIVEFRPAPAPASAGEPNPGAAPFLVSEFRRIPCVLKSRKAARVQPLNAAIDQYGPGFDGFGGAGRPLDGWDKLDHWSMGYWNRYDNFFGYDY